MDAFEVRPVQAKFGTWVLGIGSDEIRLVPSGQNPPALSEPLSFTRADVPERLHLMPLAGGAAVLAVRPTKYLKLDLKLEKEQRRKLEAWLGPPTLAQLSWELKRRYAYSLPLAILLVLSALPLPASLGAGLEPMPFDAVSFALGAGLLLAWAWSRLRPARWIFLVDAGWWLLLAGNVVSRTLFQESSKLWLVVVPLAVIMATVSTNKFRSYRGVKRGSLETRA